MRESFIHRSVVGLGLGTALALSALGLSACGGGGEQQDAGEPSGTYKVDMTARFAKKQSFAVNQVFALRVRNRSDKQIPNLTATVDGFNDRSTQPGEADPQQPVWIVNKGPTNGVTALTNTWALGSVPAGGERTFVWHVTPMQSGVHSLHYRVDASLYGTSKAELADGGVPEGSVSVAVNGNASKTGVDPDTGQVVVTGVVPDS